MDKHEDTLLKETAVAIGEAAGKVAVLAKSVLPHAKTAPAATPKKKTGGKLPPQNKSRLPRKEKKSLARKKAKASAK